MSGPKHPHSRRNPLTGEWLLVSPQRLSRPWHGQVEEAEQDVLPSHDPDCALCPGSMRANGRRNPGYTGPYVFDNDFPALTTESENGRSDHPLLESRPETGCCRVICYTERHDQRFATMGDEARTAALEKMIEEFAYLDSLPDIAYVTAFENRGRMMGCSNPHPHAQFWATSNVPTEAAKELVSQRDYFDAHGEPLLLDYAATETEDGSRLLVDEQHWLVVVPYWAVWPYETLVIPRRAVQSPDELQPAEIEGLAAALGMTLEAYERLFKTSVPYSMGFHPRPSDGRLYPGWQFHVHICPPLLRSATVRKHLVGFEMLGQPQRDLTPEAAAANLRRSLHDLRDV